MADDRIKILEERLTRLEAALSQQPAANQGFTSPGGFVVDPAPFPGGFRPIPRPPSPVVDPAPWPWWGGHYQWPHPVVDPAPWPRPVVDPLPWPNPVVDPAPSVRPTAATAAASFARIGHIGDPPPIDISRFSASQLEATLHTINAERARLDSMETMVKQQLDRLQQKEG